MTARLSLYHRAEQELYRLDRAIKGQFYDFSHRFRSNPQHPALRLKKLKGDSRIYSARIDEHYRALLAKAGMGPDGQESWLILAVRHRKDVYEQLSVAVNRITGEIEFVDLSVVGQSALQRAGIQLTPVEPEHPQPPHSEPVPSEPDQSEPGPSEPAEPSDRPLLADYGSGQLRDLGVAESLIDLALTVTTSAELDLLVRGAPLLSTDVLYGLASGMSLNEVRTEITEQMAAATTIDPENFAEALIRTPITTVDEAIRSVLEQGDFREWKVFPHPSQRRLYQRHYNGPARVSGGPGTGKTVVALHRVNYLADALPPGSDPAILLTTFTRNLAADLRARLTWLMDDPTKLARVEVCHVDQLAARVLGENAAPGTNRARVDDRVAMTELRNLLIELGEHTFDAEFLKDEWEQVILGQSIPTRAQYFQARQAGRGRAVTRPERAAIWRIIEQLTARLDKLGVETWAQAAERAARFEIERARRVAAAGVSDSQYLTHRYQHIVVDEAQDLRPAHWKMLRAMVGEHPNDLFIAGDTHQRIYDNQVSLGAVGINIRGRAARLTLSYRTTREILTSALSIMSGETVDDLDDGVDTLAGYRSVLHGPGPVFTGYPTWQAELDGLAITIRTWRDSLATDDDGKARDPRGLIAVCVAAHGKIGDVVAHLTDAAGLTCAELTKDGPRGDGEIHVGTMHRFKGLEYQRIAIVAASDGVVPRASINRFADTDPRRYQRERRKDRSLLFVAATRARDSLAVSWHGAPSPFLPR